MLPSFCPLGEGGGSPAPPGRTAWCYGPPGAARALALAGSALGQPELAELGTELLLASLDQPAEVAWLNSATFCHGLAGVLHIAARMAEASDDRRLAGVVPQLCARLLDAFEPDSLLGFRNLEADGGQVDTPALLDGAAGVALVLLASNGDFGLHDHAQAMSATGTYISFTNGGPPLNVYNTVTAPTPYTAPLGAGEFGDTPSALAVRPAKGRTSTWPASTPIRRSSSPHGKPASPFGGNHAHTYGAA